MQSNKPTVFTLTSAQITLLKKGLVKQGFSFTTPQYTLFSAKKEGVICTVYESRKTVLQGKGIHEFIEFYFEPEILQSCPFTHPQIDTRARIGVDESGKGDFFGPLCIAAVYVEKDSVQLLSKMGVQDSKKIADKEIKKLASAIKKLCPYHLVQLPPNTYNTLYTKFKNLNRLLAWGHATVIEKLHEKTSCSDVILDQFAHESLVVRALEQKKVAITPIQRHRGEEDIAVAAASIVARDAFVSGIENLGTTYNIKLPKGASKEVIESGKKLLLTHGVEALNMVCKKHFKTYLYIVQ